MKLNKTHISNSTKTSKPIFINHISISQYKQQIHEKEGFKLEIEWKKLKTHTFSWRLRKDWREKWSFCEWKWQFWERERRKRQRGLHVMRGKLKSFFKNCLRFNLICAKHAFFTTHMTCEQVAKMSCQNPLCKILKNFSKSFSRLGLPLTNESRTSLSNLVTGLPLAK